MKTETERIPIQREPVDTRGALVRGLRSMDCLDIPDDAIDTERGTATMSLELFMHWRALASLAADELEQHAVCR